MMLYQNIDQSPNSFKAHSPELQQQFQGAGRHVYQLKGNPRPVQLEPLLPAAKKHDVKLPHSIEYHVRTVNHDKKAQATRAGAKRNADESFFADARHMHRKINRMNMRHLRRGARKSSEYADNRLNLDLDSEEPDPYQEKNQFRQTLKLQKSPSLQNDKSAIYTVNMTLSPGKEQSPPRQIDSRGDDRGPGAAEPRAAPETALAEEHEQQREGVDSDFLNEALNDQLQGQDQSSRQLFARDQQQSGTRAGQYQLQPKPSQQASDSQPIIGSAARYTGVGQPHEEKTFHENLKKTVFHGRIRSPKNLTASAITTSEHSSMLKAVMKDKQPLEAGEHSFPKSDRDRSGERP